MPNLSGTWRLDQSRSDSLLSYLLSFGVPELAAQASNKLADILYIEQGPDSITISRMSKYGKDVKHYKFGEEISLKSVMGGSHKSVCTMYPDCIKISTAFTQNKGHLIDVKRLEENGKVLHTTLQYINSENKEIIYQRYFIKSIYTAEELISQSDDNRMTLKGMYTYNQKEDEYSE